jgi:hypothetical protein
MVIVEYAARDRAAVAGAGGSSVPVSVLAGAGAR